MRGYLLLGAMIGLATLAACNRSADEVAPEAIELTFDGANASTQDGVLAHGERLSHVLGCTGCHRENLQGGDFGDLEPPFKGLYASNLTQSIQGMDESVLEKILREGVHPDRGDMWVMPSGVIDRLSAPDMTALIAYLRSLKPEGERSPPPVLSPAAQGMIEQGVLKTASASVADYRANPLPDLGADLAYGRYLAGATCAECHGAALEGSPPFAPPLEIAANYSPEELRTLLTTGKGNSGRDLGLMGVVGASHFGYLTEGEREAIMEYVAAFAAQKAK